MNSKIIFAFVAGLAIGSVGTWKLIDAKINAKYERIAKEEIESVVREFSKDVDIKLPESKPCECEPIEEEDDSKEYISLVNDLYNNVEEGGAEKMNRPHVISPDDFGDNDDYDVVTLTYYADEILEDDNGDIIDDVDNMVGLESLSRFGEYEDDAVHVRNDVLKTDFEILRDIRTYSEANSVGSYSVDE